MTIHDADSDPDPDLARLFEAERRADESAAPGLDALLARSRPRRAAPARAIELVGMTAAFAGVVMAAVLLLRAGGSRRSLAPVSPSAEPVQIAEWRSPTDFLLRTPGSDLWTRVPVLALPADPTSAVTPVPTKGVER